MFSTILVPLDGSDTGALAVPAAVEMARRFGARLLLLQVIETGRTSFVLGLNAATGGLTDPSAITTEMQARVDTARAYLSAYAEQLGSDGLAVQYEVRDGAPGEAILDAARESGADLIVISSHGRGGLGRFVFGSVTDHTVRNAAVPVLVIHARAVASA
jgi:nucleotide-binding universal stress UspA family protein